MARKRNIKASGFNDLRVEHRRLCKDEDITFTGKTVKEIKSLLV